MKLSEFRAGQYLEKSGHKIFKPEFINREYLIDNNEIIFLLSIADRYLGELNAFSQLIPDIDFFIKMLVVKESLLSSRIEGTKTDFEEALQDKKYIDPELRDDWQEVHNYIEAMNYAQRRLTKLPLSNRLIKEIHSKLISGVRGASRQSGEFRITQNWIGGSSISDAIFIPPSADMVPDLMSDLEKFMQNDKIKIPHLIKIAIAHYQFETIHPFLDGNGRIGRLLIVLYLIEKKLLSKPTLYISDFFEKNRILYYDNLQIVRETNNLAQWIKFFLQAIITTSEKGIDTFKAIIKLVDEVQSKISTLGKRQKIAKEIINYLYSDPVIRINDLVKLIGVEFSTAKRLVDKLVELKILTETTGYKRNRIFIFEDYLNLFR
ncbi:MAG: Fic family protein [Ignavibacterium sp.]|nr:Fic family protein [Ignavibacterium sp.]